MGRGVQRLLLDDEIRKRALATPGVTFAKGTVNDARADVNAGIDPGGGDGDRDARGAKAVANALLPQPGTTDGAGDGARQPASS